jgi:hypothetical protein
VGLVRLIHSLDSHRLAEEIDRKAASIGLVQDVLVQVNVAMEESKTGIEPDALLDFADSLSGLPNLRMTGLSTIAPYMENPEETRWIFKRLRELGEECEEEIEGLECLELSMGMTNDFEIAVEEGSTIVRVGTALFGARSH